MKIITGLHPGSRVVEDFPSPILKKCLRTVTIILSEIHLGILRPFIEHQTYKQKAASYQDLKAANMKMTDYLLICCAV